jgi:hypothetical protein
MPAPAIAAADMNLVRILFFLRSTESLMALVYCAILRTWRKTRTNKLSIVERPATEGPATSAYSDSLDEKAAPKCWRSYEEEQMLRNTYQRRGNIFSRRTNSAASL